MTSYDCQPVQHCAGAEILRRANEEADAALIAESMGHSSDEAVVSYDEPPGIRRFDDEVPGEHPTITLEPQVAWCELCSGTVEVGLSQISMKKCVITKGCERAWGQQHPDFYNPDKHDPMNTPRKAPTPELLPCGGDRCSALIRFLSPEGEFLGDDPKIEVGICGVDVAGAIWRERGIDTLNRMRAAPIGDDVERFDGEVVTQRDIAAIERRVGIADETPPAAGQPE
jgi:hypothetical protein